jgi:hypothetical protein
LDTSVKNDEIEEQSNICGGVESSKLNAI